MKKMRKRFADEPGKVSPEGFPLTTGRPGTMRSLRTSLPLPPPARTRHRKRTLLLKPEPAIHLRSFHPWKFSWKFMEIHGNFHRNLWKFRRSLRMIHGSF
jgi:hypothetical protein